MNTKKDVLLIIGGWNAKVGSQEVPRIIGNFDLPVQNEARQSLTEFCQENMLVTASTLFNNPRDGMDTPNVNDQIDQMVNIKIRLRSLQPEMEKLYTVIKNKTWN